MMTSPLPVYPVERAGLRLDLLAPPGERLVEGMCVLTVGGHSWL